MGGYFTPGVDMCDVDFSDGSRVAGPSFMAKSGYYIGRRI